MKPRQFAFAQPAALDEALETLASAPEDSKVIAGGQSLVPVMNFRLAEPPCLVDITRIAELGGITSVGADLTVGTVTRTRSVEVSEEVRERLPILAHAASWVGHLQIRTRGTVGGSIAHADPAAEMAAIATLLDAEMTVASVRGTRKLRPADFFDGMMTTVLEPDEVLTSVRFPLPAPGAAWGFSEYAQRHGDFALAGAACIEADGGVRLVAFGPTDRAVRCTRAEEMLAGSELHEISVSEVAQAAVDEVAERTDVYSDESAHRVRMVRPMVERALRQAIQRKEA